MGLNKDEVVNSTPQHYSAGYTDRMSVKSVSTTTGALSGASKTLSSLIPAGALVLGVVCEVLTAITGATTFKVGDGTDDDRWGAAVPIAAGSKSSSANFTGTQPVEAGPFADKAIIGMGHVDHIDQADDLDVVRRRLQGAIDHAVQAQGLQDGLIGDLGGLGIVMLAAFQRDAVQAVAARIFGGAYAILPVQQIR